MSGRYAFVTLVTSDAYLPGALAVAAALREVHPSPPVDPEVPFQTVCIVTPETVNVDTVKRLRKAFDLVIGVEVIGGQTAAELHLLGRPDLHSVLTKLHVFRFTQFDKIIFLDADVLPIRPLSHLFTLPHEFSAVPDVGWPDIFNSGIMVLTPGEDKFNEIMDVLKTRGSWDGGDQGVLNEWRGSNWNRLSFTYNTTPTAAYTYAPAYERFGSQISAIHFIGENKPWSEIPYRAPSSTSQVHQLSQTYQQQIPPFQVVSAVPPDQLTASTFTAPLQSYAYSSLVDRWFEVYDRNYRQLAPGPAPGLNFEAQKYENVWNDSSADAPEIAPASALGLEDLRRLALEGDTATFRSAGEGEYRSLPLEGRIDLMRPRQEFPREPVLAESHDKGEPSRAAVPSEDHVRTPTVEQPQWLGHAPSTERHVSTPGPHEVPASPSLAPLPLPPSGAVSPIPISRGLSHDQEVMRDYLSTQAKEQPEAVTTTVVVEQPAVSPGSPYQTAFPRSEKPGTQPESISHHPPAQEDSQPQGLQHAPPGEPRRPVSPPIISWNPAVEPPPNVPPTPSTFPTDAYFPNAWDLPSRAHEAGSAISSQFFDAPPHAQIPQQLIKEGHYKDVTGPQQETSPQPDFSKVTAIFPWEQKPRHVPGRVFPEGEPALPGIQYIENLLLTEPEHESELSTPDTTHEERVQVASPQTQFPSPAIGLPAAGFINVWDSVPSIQKYAARLVKPPAAAPPLAIPPPRMRRRTDSYRSRSEQSDANSMDGDVEDEIDDNDSDVEAGGRFSSSERSSGRGSRRGSKVVVGSPPSGMSRSRIGKKEYRSYGVQTVPKEVRSIAVQVSQEFSTFAGKSGGKDVPEPESTVISASAMPHIELPKQSTAQELLTGPEPTALATPAAANVASFMRGPSGHQQHITPSGMVSPRLQEPYSALSPSQTPQDVSPGTQSPVSRRQAEKTKLPQIGTEQPQPVPSLVVRTSSQEPTDLPLGAVSPVDAPSTSQSKPARRRWNPATGLDVFKRSSEEVLARFLRLGSWEDESHPSAQFTA